MNTSPEIWKDVKGYGGFYQISNFGRFASIKNNERFIRKINLCTHYPSVSLKKRPQDKNQKSATIHKLVAEAFLGERPPGFIIRHIDGNRYNNSYSNLIYGTPEENRIDSVNHGTHKGGKNGRAILNDISVKLIKLLLSNGVSVKIISQEIRVSTQTIYAIKYKRNWGNI